MKKWKLSLLCLCCLFLFCACQEEQSEVLIEKIPEFVIEKEEQQRPEPIPPQTYIDAVQADCYVSKEELAENPAYRFLGTWQAAEYVETGAIYAGDDDKKYKGTRFYLGRHSFYTAAYTEINEPLDVITDYFIREEDKIEFEIYHRLYWGLDEVIPAEQKKIMVLYSLAEEMKGEDLIGILLKDDQLLAHGGTCWYRYERVET